MGVRNEEPVTYWLVVKHLMDSVCLLIELTLNYTISAPRLAHISVVRIYEFDMDFCIGNDCRWHNRGLGVDFDIMTALMYVYLFVQRSMSIWDDLFLLLLLVGLQNIRKRRVPKCPADPIIKSDLPHKFTPLYITERMSV